MKCPACLILAILAIWSPTAAEEAETETPPPDCALCRAKEALTASWLQWGLDQRSRAVYRRNDLLVDDGPGREILFQRHRTRLWATVKPFENLNVNGRLVWEWFNFCRPEADAGTPDSDALFDRLNVQARNVASLPLTVTVGRQNLQFGDGWILYEGTPLDGTRTWFFDAIRLTWDAADLETKVDLIYIRNRADSASHIKPFNDIDRDLSDRDESGAILHVTNTSRPDTELNGYFVYKHNEEDTPGHRYGYGAADLYTFGGRVAGRFGELWRYRAEGAVQFGDKLGVNLCPAFGLNTRLTRLLADAGDSELHAVYEYRSGGRDDRSDFDILWGRYPQWSLLYNNGVDIIGSEEIGQSSNLHRLDAGASTRPLEDLLLQLDYHLLFADDNRSKFLVLNDGTLVFTRNRQPGGLFRGQLITTQAQYRHNEHATSTARVEVFCPGDFYGEALNDTALFVRYQLMLTW